MRPPVPRRSWRSLPVWGLLAVACTASSTDESIGTLDVLASTSGANPDLDGYRVEVDAEPVRVIGPQGSISFAQLASGEHRVALSGVAPNCAVADSTVRGVLIESGQVDTVAYSITCDSTTGSVRVRTMTTGVDLDPNGYTVLVDDVPVAEVSDTGLTEVPVTAVRHRVSLGGATPNCSLAGDNPRSVDVGTGTSVPIEFAIQCVQAALGPGDQISFTTGRNGFSQVALANADGTGGRTLAGAFQDAAWSPDGSSIAVGAGSSILVATVDRDGVLGGTSEIDLSPNFIQGLAWSPDGARLAVTDADPEGECQELSTMRLDGSDQQFLSSCELYSGNPSWSPGGTTIALSAFPFDVLERVILLYDASGASAPGRLDTGSFEAVDAAWSPDGRRIAFASRGVEGFESDIYVVDLDGQHLTRLTRAPGDDRSPAWSPDGTRIAFVSDRDGNPEIYVMGADGSDPTRITNHPAADSLPAWRPSALRTASRSPFAAKP